jgi:hypothetical protein
VIAEDPDPVVARGAETTTEVLREFAERGIDTQFVPGPGAGCLRCTSCASVSTASEFTVIEERRLEGASDPDDLVLVVAASCPVCRAGGAMVLGYGPEASEVDTELVLGLTRTRP